ncbi:hypothetical protein XENTR_v10003253 [Xenopus tropicalis]|uniref:B-cell differentiation antigen CD72-like n=2 Tax=Xenopus tropicalis TaxID=8364 RepID=A0A8J1K1X7_XENTR|nr:B-cell differentiation antigen CD72-like [Xenopus tropicalis]KAE8636991.1 hypothetical protein XENTR_v10003253 [Xenopus tropicalis]
MNEGVTYADLKFINLPLKECQTAEAEDNEDGAMYENVNPNLNIPSRRAENSARGSSGNVEAAGEPLKLPSNVTLLLLLFCLISLSSTIGVTIKYFQVSRELQTISRNYIELNSSLSRAIQSTEYERTLTNMELTSTQYELNQLGERHTKLNRTLQLCYGTERQTKESLMETERLYKETMGEKQLVIEEKQKIQMSLEHKEEQLKMLNGETCPENWILFGRRCLYFSEDENTWTESRIFCEKEKASLLVLRNNDWKLKDFIAKKQTDYWIWKSEWDQSIEFPRYRKFY